MPLRIISRVGTDTHYPPPYSLFSEAQFSGLKRGKEDDEAVTSCVASQKCNPIPRNESQISHSSSFFANIGFFLIDRNIAVVRFRIFPVIYYEL